MMRKLFKALAVLIVLALVVAGVGFYVITRPAVSDRLTQYVGQQVAGIANTYLVPDLAFDRVKFDRPSTVTLSGVTLTAPDGTRVIDLDTMVVTLAELPAEGEPIRIESIKLSQGTVTIVRDPSTGDIRGLVPIVERGVSEQDEADVEENFRLSNVLVLEHVEITDVDLSIDLGDGSGPMRLDGFELSLDVKEAADEPGAPSGPGWYALAFTSGRAPGLELDVDGRLNIDTFEAFVRSCTGTIELQESTYGSLPGRLADALRARDARGQLEFTASGSVPLTNPVRGAALDLSATLTGLNLASGDFRLPIDRATARADLSAGIATISNVHAEMIKGTVDAQGEINLAATAMPTALSWTLDALDIEDLLTAQGADAPDLAGILSGAGSATTNLADPSAALSGSGEIHLTDGRLVAVPGLTQLAKVASIAGFGSAADKNHRANAAYTLTPAGVRLEESEIITNALGARATGLIGFDATLDLSVNAGPLEKVQELLGDVGKILGKVTDQLVTYKVGGTTAEPKVSVAPLGIGG